tara:strand:- start:94 stop:357 length:264 start_codon:yes stop_codon:yes gene_type:complete
MPVAKKSKSQAVEKTKQNSINIAEVGKKYYDVLDVYSNKVISKIVENSSKLNIDKSAIQEINNIINTETANAKNWGIDQLIKAIKSN